MSDEGFLQQLHHQQVLPVLRVDSAAEGVEAATTLLRQGLQVVELTATTPHWDKALHELRAGSRDDALVGLGSVLDETTARAAIDAGARFLVSPWPAPAVRRVAADAGVPFLEGTFSPSEVAAAAALGPVKLFPAHVGGPEMLRSLRALLPDAVVVPTGRLSIDDVPAWLAAGAHAVGIGTDLLRPGAVERLHDLLQAAGP